jgi:hypothetical protein
MLGCAVHTKTTEVTIQSQRSETKESELQATVQSIIVGLCCQTESE